MSKTLTDRVRILEQKYNILVLNPNTKRDILIRLTDLEDRAEGNEKVLYGLVQRLKARILRLTRESGR